MEIKAIQGRVSEISLKDTVPNLEKKSVFSSESILREIGFRKGSSELLRSFNELESVFAEILQKKVEDKDAPLDLERLNRILLSINKNLKIELDEKLNIPVYKIIDITTNEVLKQIPLEEILRFKRALFEFLANYLKKQLGIKGILLNREV